ncbi:hypothetical protein BN000_02258 [Neobacillus massiliamazoniensis]|uniref:Uncharacterized protein n=1 Tax=Neobacillus massiliamazoniensis TaxID=1499688 RepID=A0A0U1NWF1_9BACI|nr:hypothetical protein BN000_02258 [Neobacillus massiliamazoniensis]
MGVNDGCQAPLVYICACEVDTLFLGLKRLARHGAKDWCQASE